SNNNFPVDLTSNFFPSASNIPGGSWGIMAQMKKDGLSKLGAVYCAEVPVCAGYADRLSALSQLIPPLTLPWRGQVLASAPINTAAADGTTFLGLNVPTSDRVTPGGKLFNKMIDKYSPDLRSTPAWNELLMTVFSGLELFRTIGNDGHFSSATKPAAVFKQLY